MLNSPPIRRWFQFNLRAMFVAVSVCAALLAYREAYEASGQNHS